MKCITLPLFAFASSRLGARSFSRARAGMQAMRQERVSICLILSQFCLNVSHLCLNLSHFCLNLSHLPSPQPAFSSRKTGKPSLPNAIFCIQADTCLTPTIFLHSTPPRSPHTHDLKNRDLRGGMQRNSRFTIQRTAPDRHGRAMFSDNQPRAPSL